MESSTDRARRLGLSRRIVLRRAIVGRLLGVRGGWVVRNGEVYFV